MQFCTTIFSSMVSGIISFIVERIFFVNSPQDELTKKMPTEKPEIFSGFLRFLPFSSLFLNSDFSENKKMPIGIFGQGSRSEPLPFDFCSEY